MSSPRYLHGILALVLLCGGCATRESKEKAALVANVTTMVALSPLIPVVDGARAVGKALTGDAGMKDKWRFAGWEVYQRSSSVFLLRVNATNLKTGYENPMTWELHVGTAQTDKEGNFLLAYMGNVRGTPNLKDAYSRLAEQGSAQVGKASFEVLEEGYRVRVHCDGKSHVFYPHFL